MWQRRFIDRRHIAEPVACGGSPSGVQVDRAARAEGRLARRLRQGVSCCNARISSGPARRSAALTRRWTEITDEASSAAGRPLGDDDQQHCQHANRCQACWRCRRCQLTYVMPTGIIIAAQDMITEDEEGVHVMRVDLWR